MHKFKILFRIIFVLCLAGTVLFSYISDTNKCDYLLIEINKISFCSRIAESYSERATGLSGVNRLEKFDALLLIFENQEKHGIWMKNMLIPIDILWLDSNKTIVHKEENVLPDTYPRVFYPKSNAKYVLETKAGFIEDNGLSLLDQFRW